MSDTEKKYLSISNGTYTLSESDEEDRFYFYRNDEGDLTGDEEEPMELFQAYMMRKFMEGELTDMVICNVRTELSTDNKCIRLTVEHPDVTVEEDVDKMNLHITADEPEYFELRSSYHGKNDKKPGFLRRLFRKLIEF